jgi:hypothetical protein
MEESNVCQLLDAENISKDTVFTLLMRNNAMFVESRRILFQILVRKERKISASAVVFFAYGKIVVLFHSRGVVSEMHLPSGNFPESFLRQLERGTVFGGWHVQRELKLKFVLGNGVFYGVVFIKFEPAHY